MPDDLTTAEAAAELGVTPSAVRMFIHRGQLTSIKHGRDRFITRAELDRFQRERPVKTGRPPVENPSPAALAKRKSRAKQQTNP